MYHFIQPGTYNCTIFNNKPSLKFLVPLNPSPPLRFLLETFEKIQEEDDRSGWRKRDGENELRKPRARIRGKTPRNANARFRNACRLDLFLFPVIVHSKMKVKSCAGQRDDFSHPRVHFTAPSRGLLSDLLELVYTGSKTYLAFSCETLTTLPSTRTTLQE